MHQALHPTTAYGPVAGTAIIEIDAPFLTVKLLM